MVITFLPVLMFQNKWNNQQNDAIQVVLHLDRDVSETEPSWNDLVENASFNFQNFPISMIV
jgi:hypothetical protein